MIPLKGTFSTLTSKCLYVGCFVSRIHSKFEKENGRNEAFVAKPFLMSSVFRIISSWRSVHLFSFCYFRDDTGISPFVLCDALCLLFV